jgi:Protein of unknown function (DUF2794)
MSDLELDDDNRAGGRLERSGDRGILPLQAGARQKNATPDIVSFDRAELREILNLYGRKVAEGEWRDYAIDFTAQEAVFSIFRRACEYPLYRIFKNPRLARKQGAYSVVAATGLVLKRGHDLKNVIRVLDKKLTLVSG